MPKDDKNRKSGSSHRRTTYYEKDSIYRLLRAFFAWQKGNSLRSGIEPGLRPKPPQLSTKLSTAFVNIAPNVSIAVKNRNTESSF
jgi:hypothetical protein